MDDALGVELVICGAKCCYVSAKFMTVVLAGDITIRDFDGEWNSTPTTCSTVFVDHTGRHHLVILMTVSAIHMSTQDR